MRSGETHAIAHSLSFPRRRSAHVDARSAPRARHAEGCRKSPLRQRRTTIHLRTACRVATLQHIWRGAPCPSGGNGGRSSATGVAWAGIDGVGAMVGPADDRRKRRWVAIMQTRCSVNQATGQRRPSRALIAGARRHLARVLTMAVVFAPLLALFGTATPAVAADNNEATSLAPTPATGPPSARRAPTRSPPARAMSEITAVGGAEGPLAPPAVLFDGLNRRARAAAGQR